MSKLNKFKSNGQKVSSRRKTNITNRRISAIANSIGAVSPVRNMMPMNRVTTRRLDIPRYLFIKTNGKISIENSMNGGTEEDIPWNGLEFCSGLEWLCFSDNAQTMRIKAFGSTVNFVSNNDVLPVNIYEKWSYGQLEPQIFSKYDTTWRPLDYDNKQAQQYKTYVPADTEGYMTFATPADTTENLRKFYFALYGECKAPAAKQFIGTLNICVWIEAKMKQVEDELDSTYVLKQKIKLLEDKLNLIKGLGDVSISDPNVK